MFRGQRNLTVNLLPKIHWMMTGENALWEKEKKKIKTVFGSDKKRFDEERESGRAHFACMTGQNAVMIVP